MLLEFNVQNYRSFKSKATLSMVASSLKEHPEHVVRKCSMKLLKTGVLYGANASGKSNLIRALNFMRNFILTSQKKTDSTDKISIIPFKLSPNTINEPTMFEISLLIGDCIYRYGFEVTQEAIRKEWLYKKDCKAYSQEKSYISRNGLIIESTPRIKKHEIRNNALILSYLDQFNDEYAKLIFSELKNMVIILDTRKAINTTLESITSGTIPKDWVKNLLIASDLDIDDFDISEHTIGWDKFEEMTNSEISFKNHPEELKMFQTHTIHNYYDNEAQETKHVALDFQSCASMGTQVLLGLSGYMYRILRNGGIIVVDELDTSLHYYLMVIIIKLFQDSSTNPKDAQLFFSTHNINYLDRSKFRRDEIWFTDKDNEKSSVLYSLAEFNVRNDASYGKDYIKAKYGAIPYTDFSKFASLLIHDNQ